MNTSPKPVRPITADERAAYARHLQSALAGPLFDAQPGTIMQRIEQEVVRVHRYKSLVEALATGMLGTVAGGPVTTASVILPSAAMPPARGSRSQTPQARLP